MPKSTVSSADKARRSRMAGVLLILAAVALAPSAVLAWQGESIVLAVALTVFSVAAAAAAVMGFRASRRWAQLGTETAPGAAA